MIDKNLSKTNIILVAKKALLTFLLISLSLPIAAEYKIIFGNSNLELPEPPTPEEPTVQSALSFDGVDDYVNMNATYSAGAKSIETWIYVHSYPSNNQSPIVGERWYSGGPAEGSQHNFYLDDGHLNLNVYTSETDTSQSITSTNLFPTNEWVHVAYTYQSNGYSEILKNGTVVASGFLPEDLGDHTLTKKIGTMHSGPSDEVRDFFDGLISNVRVWNTARTPTEIQNNMNEELTGYETGLEAYYELESGSGSIAVDSAGNNDGTINGATWVEK